jgi:hypothetical protein
MKAVIKLWDEDRSPVAELIVPQDTSYTLCTHSFVARCWEMVDQMAMKLTPSDQWGVEMTITCDFAKPAPKKRKGNKK